jgi:hypothetical protein
MKPPAIYHGGKDVVPPASASASPARVELIPDQLAVRIDHHIWMWLQRRQLQWMFGDLRTCRPNSWRG